MFISLLTTHTLPRGGCVELLDDVELDELVLDELDELEAVELVDSVELVLDELDELDNVELEHDELVLDELDNVELEDDELVELKVDDELVLDEVVVGGIFQAYSSVVAVPPVPPKLRPNA